MKDRSKIYECNVLQLLSREQHLEIVLLLRKDLLKAKSDRDKFRRLSDFLLITIFVLTLCFALYFNLNLEK